VGASIGCCLLLLITSLVLSRRGRVAAVIAASVDRHRRRARASVLGVHFVSDVLAGITWAGVGAR